MKNQNHGGKPVDATVLSKLCIIKFCLIFFLLFIFCPGANSQEFPERNRLSGSYISDAALEKNVRNTLKQSSMKLQLVENNGQLGLSQNVVAYFSSKNEIVFIEKDRLRIVVIEPAGNKTGKKENSSYDKAEIAGKLCKKEFRYNTFNIVFKGSGGGVYCEKKNPSATKWNFINASLPGKNEKDVASYGEITLKNIYPGIDLRLYSKESGELEFDWIIWPGADAAKINMQFEGQKDLEITKQGDLQVALAMGNFNMHLPESYYVTPNGKEPVSARFHLYGKNKVRFTGFNKNFKKYPLVIDPDLLWGTFFDGGNANFDEYLYGIEFNYNNNLIYCAGAASMQVSTVYAAALSLGYDSTFAGIPDALIYALTKNGQTIQYITYLGGAGNDVAIGVSLSNSFVYTCGYTSSADFPITKNVDGKIEAFDTVYHGNNDGFIAVFNLQLDSLVYSSYLGGTGDDKALTIRALADSSFDISMEVGDTLPVTGANYILNPADSVFGGSAEAWIGKFTLFDTLNFGTYIGGNNTDLVNDFQVLSNGDIVFIGNTRNITEVNASIPDNGTGQEALFGRIHVPVSGSVSFDIIDKFGGSTSDFGWGIYSLGDSVSILVGQTNSGNFPLGPGPVFQNTSFGNYDGFIARVNNDGSGGYKASFAGGSDKDILVSVRPVTVNGEVALLSFGTTQSTDLPTRNFNSGSFFSNVNSGGLDMIFLICDVNFATKFYFSYIGGSANDYLGITGAPLGSNHLFYNDADSVLYLGTTTHSFETTQAPKFVGRGAVDYDNIGVPVFDEIKNNGINDTHVIVAISTKSLFALPVRWLSFRTSVLSDCSIQLSWTAIHEENVMRYVMERSTDGVFFEAIGNLPAGSNTYNYNDRNFKSSSGRAYYRIRAQDINGRNYFTAVNLVFLCDQLRGLIKIYPTITSNYFTVTWLNPAQTKNIVVELFDAGGKKIMTRQLSAVYGTQTIYPEKIPASGAYLVIVRNTATGQILQTQKIIMHN